MSTIDLDGVRTGLFRQAKRLPVAVSPVRNPAGKPGEKAPQVRVTVATREVARQAGVDGVLLSVAPADRAASTGPVRVKVSYAGFRGAFGGDWAARLRLVAMPACALTTPNVPGCRVGRALPTENDTRAGTLTATTDLPAPTKAGAQTPGRPGGVVLGVTGEDDGPTGSFKATSLQPSGSWQAGGSNGSFGWSYPIDVPAVPGGLQPNVALNYNSQSVDGRTAASNNQSSWIGDGWDWEPGYIERRYKGCNDDKANATNTTKVGDLCWFNDNATLSLGGMTTELVHDGKTWRPATDSGEKVEKLAGATNGDSGTDGLDGKGEHWRITTTSGTQYYFGLNRLPGWSDHGEGANDPTTNSTWTVPVFGNHVGEPCYNSSFAGASCKQAWRWQLDYVVDPLGNAMAYYWDPEANNYGLNVSDTTGKSTATRYVRGGQLKRIEYGLRDGAAYSAKAMAKVEFGSGERCVTACTTFDEANAHKWPDVPFDLYCKDDVECKGKYSPSFWSRERLASITTKVLTAGNYQDVDKWELTQSFPPAGDGISTPMWLSSIRRTGLAGGTLPLPPTTFEPIQKPNRIDKVGDGLAPFIRLRMAQITTETGGTIGVDYHDPNCTATALPPTDDTNGTRCFPVKWAFEGDKAKIDWFATYPVKQVIEGDNLKDSPDTVTTYSYPGGAEWAKSTDEFTKAEDRTYSVARGFGRVQTRKGAGSDQKTLTETRYFRGIEGAQVKDSTGAALTDHPHFAGMVRESVGYNGDGGELVAATSYTPWRSAKPTATRPREGLPNLDAYQTGTLQESTRKPVTGGTRTTQINRSFDEHGLVYAVTDHGDVDKTGDESCTTTTYARNSELWLLNKVSKAETTTGACGDSRSTPDTIVDSVRTYYDGKGWGNAPTRGVVTKADGINGKGDGYEVLKSTPSNCGSTKDELCVDMYGRTLAVSDAFGKTTGTSYAPASGEVPTAATITNSLQHKSVTQLDPRRGVALKVTDANGEESSTAYDALGRVTKGWLPTRPAASNKDTPSYTFDYLVRDNGPVVITTKSLTHDAKYRASYTFYDGLMRPRETQERSPDGAGRLVSHTSYNTRGEAWFASGTYFATGAAEAVLVTGTGTAYPASTETEFDGIGRPTAVVSKKFGTETKRTTTTYAGDTTKVVPPQGGTATTTVVDALGRTTELKQETSGANPPVTQSTFYRYDDKRRLSEVVDPSGAKWIYGYDVRGRQTRVTDPDTGLTTTVFDKGGRPVDVTNARGITLHTDYDDLGRKTALKKGAVTLSTWAYDTVAKGRLSSTTRYVDGKPAFTWSTTVYNRLYQPVVSKMTVPAGEGMLAGTYEWYNDYNDNTGQTQFVEQPELPGGLPFEVLSNTYQGEAGNLTAASAGDDPLISGITYDHYGRAVRQEYGALGRHLWTTSEYDEHTGGLTRAYADREVAPQRIEDTRYAYNPIGDLTEIATAYGQGATRITDTQCFLRDSLRRITSAWTNTGEKCAEAPSATMVGGPDAYWTGYTYDAVGNRKTETQYKTPSGPTADTKRVYAAPPAGKHLLPKVTQTGTDAREETFTYDAAGNTETRKIGAAAKQDLVWDDEGHLKSVTQGSKVTSFLYDTDGGRLIRRDSSGSTLYLPGGNELHVDKVGLVTGTRYYSVGGQTIAMRGGGKLTFLLSDHHGTATTQITSDAKQTVTHRKTGIFGAPRGTQPGSWAGDKGFVGGTKDADSGLTHLGAREYDPTTGRFVSVDPILDLADPQQSHGYTYGNNNPVSMADPEGLAPDDCIGRVCRKTGNDWEIKEKTKEGSGENDWISYNDPVNQTERYITDHARKYLGTGKAYRDWRKYFQSQIKPTPWRPGVIIADDLMAAAANSCTGPNAFECPDGMRDALSAIDKLRVYQYATMGDDRAFVSIRGTGRADAAKAWKAPCAQCFLAGTKVLMADGRRQAIEDIRPGDQVLATDPLTGESGPREVTDLIVTEDDKRFNELTLATPTGPERLTATHEHPFWSPSERRWVEAEDLTPGTTVRSESGSNIRVTANRPFTKTARTYNLSVADLHTYYVLAGATPVLVHNCNRAGLDFTDAERQKVYDANAAKNGGEYRCDYCGQKVERRGSRDANGNPVPGRPDDAQIDHIEPRAGGGHGGAHNGAVACRRCNRDKSTKTMEEWDDELRDFLGP
ncbi:polymorphic toxin-type HINT domain-containing protein [Streptomyces sp. NPDC097619]|uniref:polymorphic toxin-type HINT domain-containing protein n=1 Tax=Streptomyces sp. NPDC097619 TaxID=3157228 RepID=UPI00332EA1E7